MVVSEKRTTVMDSHNRGTKVGGQAMKDSSNIRSEPFMELGTILGDDWDNLFLFWVLPVKWGSNPFPGANFHDLGLF
jgi:hypothetical protein